YGRDARIPMKSDPEEEIGRYQVDLDDYRYRHAEQMQMAHEEAREHVRKEHEAAKKWFDNKHKVQNRKFPIMGDRVLVKVPAEKLGARNPKLVNEWRGPYRVVNTTENSAEVVPILGGGEKLWVPWEQTRVVPVEVPDVQIETKKKRGKRSVLRLMREQKLQTVEGLREQCERGSLVDRSSTKEGEENHQDELIWFKEEKERLEARIQECEAEKLRAEKLMRRAQRTVEKERKTTEELSRSLQQATRVLEGVAE
uniref:Integrase-type domain-containing protein n=1 Tax=Caenorhabditis japonica TaxID=281687 RepID=A0A8R1IRF9_CAEJA